MPDKNAHDHSFSENTIQLIKSQLKSAGKCPELSSVSQLMNVSERTLRRYLQAEGCSYSLLTEIARYQLVCDLKGKTLEELAEKVGYSEARSVSRLLHKYKNNGLRERPMKDRA